MDVSFLFLGLCPSDIGLQNLFDIDTVALIFIVVIDRKISFEKYFLKKDDA